MVNILVDKSNKCNGEYSLYLTFPYNQEIVNIMRSQSIRYWHPESKEWELPLKSYPKLLEQLKNYEINIEDCDKILENFDLNRKGM